MYFYLKKTFKVITSLEEIIDLTYSTVNPLQSILVYAAQQLLGRWHESIMLPEVSDKI